MRDENPEFSDLNPPPKQSLSIILTKLSGVLFCLTLFLTFLSLHLLLSEVYALHIYIIGIIFFIGCLLVLTMLNIIICTPQNIIPHS